MYWSSVPTPSDASGRRSQPPSLGTSSFFHTVLADVCLKQAAQCLEDGRYVNFIASGLLIIIVIEQFQRCVRQRFLMKHHLPEEVDAAVPASALREAFFQLAPVCSLPRDFEQMPEVGY